MPQTLARYSRMAARMYPISAFEHARIVVPLSWYGRQFCLHIDPGDGSTIPIYVDANIREQMERAVNRIQSKYVDIEVAEVTWAIGDRSGTKQFLTSIKESHARH